MAAEMAGNIHVHVHVLLYTLLCDIVHFHFAIVIRIPWSLKAKLAPSGGQQCINDAQNIILHVTRLVKGRRL